MTVDANTDSAIGDIRDMVNVRLGPKRNPDILTDTRAALPYATFGIDVDSKELKPSKRNPQNPTTPTVPEDVVRKVRLGATVAMLLAAGISARTLFQLGEIIGLPWQFAWMLPGAFDVYAFTSATVAASIPAGHKARGWAVWNARIALSFTMIGNSLVHALYLMSHNQGWTGTDYALTAVSAIPPIIVERLLHLQTKISNGVDETVAAPATSATATIRPRPAATETPVANPATATPAATVAPKPATTPRATPVVAAPVAAAGNDATVATLIPKPEQLRIVRELVATHGPDIPLAEIIERLGCHKSTASRLRAAVNEESGAVPPAHGEAVEEVS